MSTASRPTRTGAARTRARAAVAVGALAVCAGVPGSTAASAVATGAGSTGTGGPPGGPAAAGAPPSLLVPTGTVLPAAQVVPASNAGPGSRIVPAATGGPASNAAPAATVVPASYAAPGSRIVPAATTTPAPRATPSLIDAGLPSAEAWTAAARRARSFARDRGARVRFAIRVDGRTWSFRGRESTRAHSLLKATVLVAYLRQDGVRSRALTARERALLSPMIRRSANAPVSTLIDAMSGVEPLRRVGRLVGMRDFRPVASFWSASRISAVDEVRLFAQLGSILPQRHRTYALGLLGDITPSQRWGMPKAAPEGWRVGFKSGWNDRGRVLQAMRLTCGGHVVSASVLVDGGSHEGSIDLVERIGRRLLEPLLARGRDACSSVVRTAR